jgi:hypothetical protein
VPQQGSQGGFGAAAQMQMPYGASARPGQAGGATKTAGTGWAAEAESQQQADAHWSGGGGGAGAYDAHVAPAGKAPLRGEPSYGSHEPTSYADRQDSAASRFKDSGVAGEDSSGSYESAASHVDAGDWADLQEDTSQCAADPLAVVWLAFQSTDSVYGAVRGAGACNVILARRSYPLPLFGCVPC